MDLAVIFLYTWALGSQSAVTISVRSTPHGFLARVDGQTFFQKGHARRIGLYTAAPTDYIVLANLGRIVTGPCLP